MVQDVRIRFITDDGELLDTKKVLQSLSAAELQMVEDFKKVDAAAKNTGNTIQSEATKNKKAVDDTGKSVNNLGGNLKGLAGAIAGAFAISQLIDFQKKIIAVTGEFQKYRAVLTNTLGSQKDADIAMASIGDAAIKTNFSVQQLTETYIKFANRGLKLTQSEMFKLADIANSTGKSIDQLTEAFLDAFTGENERLKEFGIVARKNGETTAFTFKGVTTEVKNTQAEIQKYLLSLGDLEGVTGSTAAISKTLTGQISNLGDSYDQLLLAIGNSEDGLLSWGVTLTGDVLNAITNTIKGLEQLKKEADLKVLGQQASKASEDIEDIAKAYRNTGKSAEEAKRIALQQLTEEVEARIKANQKIADNTILRDANDQRTSDEYKASVARLEIDKKYLEALQKEYEALTPKLVAETEKQKKARIDAADKAFKAELDALNKREQLAIRESKAIGESEQQQIDIQLRYLQLREDLYIREKRASKEVNRELEVNRLELYDRLSDANKAQYDKEYKEKQEALQKQKELELSAITQAQAQEKAINDQYQLDQLNAVIGNEEATKALKDQFQRDDINALIEANEQRLQVLNLSVEERTSIEQQLVDEKKQLYEIDAANAKAAQDKITADEKAAAENRKKAQQIAIQVLTEFEKSFFDFKLQNIAQEIDATQNQQQAELLAAGDNAQAKAQINAKYQKILADQRIKQFNIEKQQALIAIAINTAQAVSKTLAVTGALGIALTGAVIALGAVQAGIVSSKKPPAYKFGTRRVPGIDTGSDTVLAQLRPGERVISKEVNDTHGRLLDAIPNISPTLANSLAHNLSNMDKIIAPSQVSNVGFDKIIEEFRDLKTAMAKRPNINIEVSKKGLRYHIEDVNSKSEFTNDYFNV